MRRSWCVERLLLLLALTGSLPFANTRAQISKPPAAAIADDDDPGPDAGYPSFLSVTVSVKPSSEVKIDTLYSIEDGTILPSPLIKAALESALGCTLSDLRESGSNFYSGLCRPAFTAHGLLREGHVSTLSIKQFAAQHKLRSLMFALELPDQDVTETVPPGMQITAAPTVQSAAIRIMGSSKASPNARSRFAFVDTPVTPIPAEITFRFGDSASSLRRAVVMLLAILLVPVAVFVWLSRKALSADVSDRAVVWFSYMRSLGWVLNGTLVGWWIALESTKAEALLQFLALSTPFPKLAAHPVFFEAFVWIPPVLVWLVCFRISQPVQRSLRGLQWTKRELTVQALYSAIAKLFPFAMFLTGLRVIASDGIQVALLWWVGAFLLRVVGARGLMRSTGMLPQALSSGDLRDRAFSMAERIGVKLQQVYLLSSGKGQLANAFARSSNSICFTDFLLHWLSQREVDYVLGHELSHLKLKHPVKLGQTYLCGILLSVCVMMVAPYLHTAPVVHYGLVFLILALFPYIFSRRFEYSADAGAVAATGDPRGAISALFKLSELNMMPIHWSHWREKWLTHPSAMRRARAIAQKAGIPFEEIPVIVREGAGEIQGYSIPTAATPGARIHSTQRITSINLKFSLALIAVLVFVPSLICLAAIHVSTPAKWVLFAAALPATLFSVLALFNYAPRFTGAEDVHSSLSKKLAHDGLQTQAWSGVFVGLAPAALPRLYDSSVNWDIGYVFVESGRICYCGEETRFALTPDQTTAIKLAEGMPSPLGSKRIYVAWKDDHGGSCGVFNIACGTGKSILADNQATAELARRLQAWWKAPAGDKAVPAELAALGSPRLRAVTSQSPAERWSQRRLVNDLILTGVFAWAGAMLFGLPMDLLSFLAVPAAGVVARSASLFDLFSSPGAGWYAIGVALLVRFITLIPQFRYRDVPKLVAESPAPRSSPEPRPSSLSQPAPVRNI